MDALSQQRIESTFVFTPSIPQALRDTERRTGDGDKLAKAILDKYASIQPPLSRSEENFAEVAGSTAGLASAAAIIYAEAASIWTMGEIMKAGYQSGDPTDKLRVGGAIIGILATTYIFGPSAIQKNVEILVTVGTGIMDFVTDAIEETIDYVKRIKALKGWMRNEGILSNNDLKRRDMLDMEEIDG